MYIRYAFFEGKVKEGREAAFASFVRERLMPIWAKLPEAEEVRVLHPENSDMATPSYALVLAIRFASLEAIERMLTSERRAESRALTGELLKMFEGRVFHINFRADQC